MAVSFSAAAFGFSGLITSVVVMMLAGGLGYFSLSMAYQHRDEKDALKPFSDAAAIAGIVGFVLMLFSLGIVAALAVLLFCLHIAINFIFREHRQLYFGLLTNFVVLMVGAVYTFSAGYLFYMLLFCVFACFYVALAFVDKQRYQIDEETANSDHAFHYVGTWRYWDKLILAGAISLLTGIIYLMIPQFPAGHLGRLPISGYGNYDGNPLEEQILPEGSDLTSRFYQMDEEISSQSNKHSAKQSTTDRYTESGGKRPNSQSQETLSPDVDTQLDNSVYFYVKSALSRYLQTRTATYFDGHSWHRLQYGWRKLANKQGDFTVYPEKPNATVGITVVKTTQENILSTDNTVGIRFPARWVASDYYDQLKTAHTLQKDSSYELQLLDNYANGRMIDTLQAQPDEKDLQLPDSLNPRIAELGANIVTGLKSDVDKANALETYLRSNYRYTLDTIANQNNIPLDDFLFGRQAGHCEYFATAMAVMLRQQGIPARLVTGFVAQDYNPVTGFFEVKGTNAHAWVQAYVDGNWSVFEATGAYQSPTEQALDPTRSTHEIITAYLKKKQEQDQRLKATQKKLTLWEKIKITTTIIWYAVLNGFSALVTFARIILPWLFAVGVLAFAGFWLFQRFYPNYLLKKQDKKGYQTLQRLAQTTPSDQASVKDYLHQHVSIYQAMLSRHDIVRLKGVRVERFMRQLQRQQLITAEQASQFIDMVNGHFYLAQTTQPKQDINRFFIALYQQGLEQLNADVR